MSNHKYSVKSKNVLVVKLVDRKDLKEIYKDYGSVLTTQAILK